MHGLSTPGAVLTVASAYTPRRAPAARLVPRSPQFGTTQKPHYSEPIGLNDTVLLDHHFGTSVDQLGLKVLQTLKRTGQEQSEKLRKTRPIVGLLYRLAVKTLTPGTGCVTVKTLARKLTDIGHPIEAADLHQVLEHLASRDLVQRVTGNYYWLPTRGLQALKQEQA